MLGPSTRTTRGWGRSQPSRAGCGRRGAPARGPASGFGRLGAAWASRNSRPAGRAAGRRRDRAQQGWRGAGVLELLRTPRAQAGLPARPVICPSLKDCALGSRIPQEARDAPSPGQDLLPRAGLQPWLPPYGGYRLARLCVLQPAGLPPGRLMGATRGSCARASMPAPCPLGAWLPRPAGLPSPPGPCLGLEAGRGDKSCPSDLCPLFLRSCVAGSQAHPRCPVPFCPLPGPALVCGSGTGSGPRMPWKRTPSAAWRKGRKKAW